MLEFKVILQQAHGRSLFYLDSDLYIVQFRASEHEIPPKTLSEAIILPLLSVFQEYYCHLLAPGGQLKLARKKWAVHERYPLARRISAIDSLFTAQSQSAPSRSVVSKEKNLV
jgi:hypothetical protein